MTTLILTIVYPDSDKSEEFHVSGDFKADSFLATVKKKAAEFMSQDLLEKCALYSPRNICWITGSKSLESYDIRNTDVMELKNKFRFLKVHLVNSSVKTVNIDETLPVYKIVEIICDHLTITNPEEYSIQTFKELIDDKNADFSGTKKLKKSKNDSESHLKWLASDKTLLQQGLDENDPVYFKKKFFYSDHGITRSDPVQVNLVYSQIRDMVIDGQIPCTLNEACQLAAFQCQVEKGNYDSEKHDGESLALKEIVPSEYRSNKNMEGFVIREYQKLANLDDLNAKYRYIQLCRSIKTYGITFFSVKEEMRNKKGKFPILLGVSRDSVLRVDPVSKEILKRWPISNLRRWAAIRGKVAFDFGDYSMYYYTIYTDEMSSISRLIGGYIKINRNRKKKELEADSEMDDAMKGMGSKAATANTGAQKTGPNNPSSAQQGLLQVINSSYAILNAASSDMSVPSMKMPLSNDPSTREWVERSIAANKQNICSQLGSLLASCAGISNYLCYTDADSSDFSAIGASISTISSNVTQIASAFKTLTGFLDDRSSDEILQSARELASLVGKLFSFMQVIVMSNPINPMVKKQLSSSGYELSKVVFEMLKQMNEAGVSERSLEELAKIAKSVTSSVAQFVSQGCKPLIQKSQELPNLQRFQDRLTSTSVSLADVSENLVSCVLITGPCLNFSSCQEQVTESSLYLRDAVVEVISAASPILKAIGMQTPIAQDFHRASQRVNDSIATVVDKSKNVNQIGDASDSDEVTSAIDKCLDNLEKHLENLWNSKAEAEQLIANTKAINVSVNQMSNLLRSKANKTDDMEEMESVNECNKLLTDASSVIITATKQLSRNPSRTDILENAINGMKTALSKIGGSRARKRIFLNLAKIVNQVSEAYSKLVAAINTASPSNRDQMSQMQLNSEAFSVSDLMSQLVLVHKNFIKTPQDGPAQIKLVTTAKQASVPLRNLINATKAAVSTVGDESAQTQLVVSMKGLESDINNMLAALESAESSSSENDVSGASQSAKDVLSQIEATIKDQKNDTLKPNGIQTLESGFETMELAEVELTNCFSQLVAAANQGNKKFTGITARDTISAFDEWFQGVKCVASHMTEDTKKQYLLLDSAKNLCIQLLANLETSEKLLKLSNSLESADSDVSNMKAQLSQNVSKFQEMLGSFSDYFPGKKDMQSYQKELVKKAALISSSKGNSSTGDDLLSGKKKLNSSCVQLSVAKSALAKEIDNFNSRKVKKAAEKFFDAYSELVSCALIVIGVASDKGLKKEVASGAKHIGELASNWFVVIQNLFSSPDDLEVRMQSDNEIAKVDEAIKEILSSISDSQSEDMTQAEHILAAAKSIAFSESAVTPYFEGTYSDCIGKIDFIFQEVENTLGPMSSSQDPQVSGKSMLKISNGVNQIAECTSTAAYILGAGDIVAKSNQEKSDKVQTAEFLDCAHQVREAVKNLLNPSNTEKEIIHSAEIIARNTSQLCDLSRLASENPSVNPVSREQFVKLSKMIATGTASLVHYIKELATDINAENRKDCSSSSVTLLGRVDELITLACSLEKSSATSKISPMGIQKMKPFFSELQFLVASAEEFLEAVKFGAQNFDTCKAELKAYFNKLTRFVRSNSPGQKEYDDAINSIKGNCNDLENAILKAEKGNLSGNTASARGDQSFKDALLINVRAISSIVDYVKKISQSGGRYSTAVKQLSQNMRPFTNNAINFSSSLSEKKNALKILNDSSEFANKAVALIELIKAFSTDLNEILGDIQKKLNRMIDTLEGSGEGSKELNRVVDDIHASIRKLNAGEFVVKLSDLVNDGITFSVMIQELTKKSKKMVEFVGQVLTKSSRPQPKVLIQFTQQLAKAYEATAEASYKACLLAKDSSVKTLIGDNASELGSLTIKMIEVLKSILIHAAGNLKAPIDNSLKTRMTNSVKEVSQAITDLMRAAKDGSKSSAACESAIQDMSEISSDLEATKTIAENGQLDPVGNTDLNMISLTEKVGKVSQKSAVSTKTLVAHAAAGNDDEIAQTVKEMVRLVVENCDSTKKAATELTSGDKETQVQLLLLGKAIADDMCSLIAAAMEASGKPMNLSATGSIAAGTMVLPEILKLRDCAKKFVKDNNDLLKNLKSLCEKSSRISNALDSAIRQVQVDVSTLLDDSMAEGSSLPGEVVNSGQALAKIVKSLAKYLQNYDPANQESVISSTQQVKSSVDDLYRSGKASVYQAPEAERKKMNDILKRLGENLVDFLTSSKSVVEGDNKAAKEVERSGKDFDNALNDMVSHCDALNPRGYVDLNDPAVVAERELVSLEKAIQISTKKFSEIQKPNDKSPDSEKSFEVQIIDGCRAISAASLALIGGVVQSQRQVAAFVMRSPGQEYDESWAKTLVSGTRKVSEAVTDLFDAAIMASKGEIQSTKVIVGARNVTSATIGLMTATSSKTNEKAATLIRFRAAAKSVTQASDKLIKVAEQSLAFEDAGDVEMLSGGKNSSTMTRARELDAQARVLQMEQELNNARTKLVRLRKGNGGMAMA